jgi:hypothetical protein
VTKPPWVTGRPLQIGDVVHGYGQGLFGRDHYACSRVEAIGADWVAVRGVATGKPAVSAREDVVELLAEARDYGRADWCLDSEGCGEDPRADRAMREQDPIEAANPYTGTDLWRLAPGLLLLQNLRYAGVSRDDALAWMLPDSMMAGVTEAYGLPIRRIGDAPGLYLAHRLDENRSPEARSSEDGG